MTNEDAIYIGMIDDVPSRPWKRAAAGARPAERHAEIGASGARIGRGRRLTACLSAVVPGAGQILRGELAAGLCFAAVLGLAAALSWAVLDSTYRLVDTLPFLGIPTHAPAWALIGLFAFAALVHTANVIHATAAADTAGWPRLIPAIASALFPGAGQMLNGHRIRASLFVAGLWCLAGLWLCASPLASAWLGTMGAMLPEAALRVDSPAVLYAATGILWALAVYDAAASAGR